MEFRNLTPFDTLCFSALAPDGQEHPVIAMKVGYRLAPIEGQPGQCRAIVMDEEPMSLCQGDTYYDEPGSSAVFEESDLAPFKPECDVIVVGHAHAPAGRATRAWEVSLGIIATSPTEPFPDPSVSAHPSDIGLSAGERQAYQGLLQAAQRRAGAQRRQQLLLSKTLRCTGPREFRHGIIGWSLTEPEPVTCVALRWEHAFGGASQIPNPRHAEDPETPAYLLNEVCFSNPLGCGWLDRRHEKLHYEQNGEMLVRLPAPQIEYLDEPIERLIRPRHPDGPLDAPTMAEVAAAYGYTPAGFGAVGRSWAPRLALAGTYDQDWEDNGWPAPPQDFDFSYWNGAPSDQQVAFLAPDVRIELLNLVEPSLSKAGRFSIQLPGHRPFVLMRMQNGLMLPLPMLTDTLRIDTDAMTLSMTHRISLPGSLDIRVLEARFEVDPAAPIIRRQPRDDAQV